MGNNFTLSNSPGTAVVVVVAVLIILGLVGLNIFLIFWVCSRNRNAAKRMELPLPPKSQKLLGKDKLRHRAKAKTLPNSSQTGTQSKAKAYANSKVARTLSYETTVQSGEVDLADYGDADFDKLNRGRRHSDPEAGLANYGQLRIKIGSSDYDTAFLGKSKEKKAGDEMYDSTIALKIKPKTSDVKEKVAVQKKKTKSKVTPKQSHDKRNSDKNTKSEDQENEYETVFPDRKSAKSNSSTKSQRSNKTETVLTDHETNTKDETEKGEEEKISIEIQTCVSFLQERAVKKARLLRKSATTQVDDDDFDESLCDDEDDNGKPSPVFQ